MWQEEGLLFSASLLSLIDLCENGTTTLDPNKDKPRSVLGVDIDIRYHNREALENTLVARIKLIEGSSVKKDKYLK